jgi:hypothetical protein
MEGHRAIAARHLLHEPRTHDSDVNPEAAVFELLEERSTGWRGLDWLGRRFDLSRISSGLANKLELAPTLYYPDLNGPSFEFQRTPNLFPMGRIVFAAAGVTALEDATAFGGMATGGPFDLTPTTSREWKLLGGILISSAIANVIVRSDGGRRGFTGAVFAAAGSQMFTIPGNGARVSSKQVDSSFEIACSAAATVDFVFYVAEEPERKA